MSYEDFPSSFYHAEEQYLSPPDDVGGLDCARRKKLEVCELIEDMLVDFSDSFCGEVRPDMNFSGLIEAAYRLAEQIEIYAKYMDGLDERYQLYG